MTYEILMDKVRPHCKKLSLKMVDSTLNRKWTATGLLRLGRKDRPVSTNSRKDNGRYEARDIHCARSRLNILFTYPWATEASLVTSYMAESTSV